MLSLKFTDSDRDFYLKKVKALKDGHSLRAFMIPEIEKDILKNFRQMIGFLPCLKKQICFGSPFERVVINKFVTPTQDNSRIKSYKQIKYLPEEVLDKIYYNRINLPRKSVFYAAYGNLVAALETNPQKGNLYTHSTWQQKEDTVITYLPIFHKEDIVYSTSEFIDDWNNYQAFLEKMDKNVAIVVEEIYDFIATVFTTPVNLNNKVEYIFSAIISDIFMNDPDYNVDCIYYPSVAGGFIASNIGLKPSVLESTFDLIELSESFCFKSSDEVGKSWLSHRTATAIAPNHKDELIKWEDQEISDKRIYQLMEQYNVIHS